jgi:hypothetical protein
MQTPDTTTSNPIRRIVLGIGLALVLLAVAATGAQAAVYNVIGTQGHGLNVRTAPSLGAGLVRNLPEGTAINIECQTRGDAVVGSTMWDKINQPVSGYVADWFTTTPVVNNPSPGLPACGSQPTPTPPPAPTTHTPTVVELALSHNGERVIPRAWAARCCGGHYYWSGYCEAFVGLVAYHEHGGYSSAMADYLAHKRAGQVHTTGVPPAGAVVYWDPGHSAAGHVGISIGGGREISTYGYVGNSYPIQIHPYNYFPNYLGWAMP